MATQTSISKRVNPIVWDMLRVRCQAREVCMVKVSTWVDYSVPLQVQARRFGNCKQLADLTDANFTRVIREGRMYNEFALLNFKRGIRNFAESVRHFYGELVRELDDPWDLRLGIPKELVAVAPMASSVECMPLIAPGDTWRPQGSNLRMVHATGGQCIPLELHCVAVDEEKWFDEGWWILTVPNPR